MHPLLLQLGPIRLYTYGLMMAVAFLAAISWASKRAPRYGVSAEFMGNLNMLIVVAGVVGGRVAYIIIEDSVADLFSLKLFEVWKGGMVFYGGFIGAVLASFIYSKMHKVDFLTVADIISPSVALGQFFGRLGCFFAGCCFGKQCSYPWAVVFRDPLSLAPKNVPIHPTQLYEAIGNFSIVLFLYFFTPHQKFKGQVFVLYLSLYAILRTYVETLRGDYERGFVTFDGLYDNEWLSTSTFIGASMLLLAVIVYLLNRKTPTSYSA